MRLWPSRSRGADERAWSFPLFDRIRSAFTLCSCHDVVVLLLIIGVVFIPCASYFGDAGANSVGTPTGGPGIKARRALLEQHSKRAQHASNMQVTFSCSFVTCARTHSCRGQPPNSCPSRRLYA